MSDLHRAMLVASCLLPGCADVGLNAPHRGAATDASWFGAQRRVELQLADGALTLAEERGSADLRTWVDRATEAIRA